MSRRGWGILVAIGYLAVQGFDGRDAAGDGDSHLFTEDDVRWAMTRADLADVKAPDESA